MQSIIEISTFAQLILMEKRMFFKYKKMMMETKKWKSKTTLIPKILSLRLILITNQSLWEIFVRTQSQKQIHPFTKRIFPSWQVLIMLSALWLKLYTCQGRQFCKSLNWAFHLPCSLFNTNCAIKFLTLLKFIQFFGLNMKIVECFWLRHKLKHQFGIKPRVKNLWTSILIQRLGQENW